VNAAARIAVFVVIALAVALTANLVLLDIANGPKDPVGQLSPRAGIVGLPAPVVRPPAPVTTTTQAPTRTVTVPVPVPVPVLPRAGEGQRGAHQDD
jgi:hypothetical protein